MTSYYVCESSNQVEWRYCEAVLNITYSSHPSSTSYGKHWTPEEVEIEFAPSTESVQSLMDWLALSGVNDARLSRNKLWIAFDASASRVEDLFETELYEYTDSREGGIHIGCDQYSVPSHLATNIDYITPGIKPSPPLVKHIDEQDGLQKASRETHASLSPRLESLSPSGVGARNTPPGYGSLPPELHNCGRNVTPPCLRALYDIPFPTKKMDAGILGVYEATDVYAQDDLDAYFAKYAPYVPQGTAPTLVSVNNATAPVSPGSAYNGGESDVDFDIAYSLLGSAPITLYQVQVPSGAYSNGYVGSQLVDPILAAVDGTYCDDDLRKDGFQCGGTNLGSVLSISYAYPETLSTYKVQQRACNEFMKLALQGHTIVVASGDFGVAVDAGIESTTDSSCDSNGCLPRTLSDETTTKSPVFNPSFPQSCPYLLSVGATQLNSDDTVRNPESVMFQPQLGSQAHENCTTQTNFFTSGGGFSNYFEQPAYQQSAVASYLARHDPGYPSYSLRKEQRANVPNFPDHGVYNRAGRGVSDILKVCEATQFDLTYGAQFPDVSANGANFNLFINQTATQQAGTSLAAPIWASIFALINQARRDAGKGPVGFVNPILYENPDVFHDITKGSNPGELGDHFLCNRSTD